MGFVCMLKRLKEELALATGKQVQVISYVIVIRMHRGVYEFYKSKGPRL